MKRDARYFDLINRYSSGASMGARCVGHGGHVPPPRFCEANVKSLILTIGASPDLYFALPVLLMCPPSFHIHLAPMGARLKEWTNRSKYRASLFTQDVRNYNQISFIFCIINYMQQSAEHPTYKYKYKCKLICWNAFIKSFWRCGFQLSPWITIFQLNIKHII